MSGASPGASAAFEFAVERGAELRTTRRVHDEPALVLCLATTIVELSRGAHPMLLDRSNVALIAAREPYRLAKKSQSVAVLTLRIKDRARRRAAFDYGPDLDLEGLEAHLRESVVLLRTRWLDEIAQRYLFEREVCEHDTSRAARFLEAEITKEIFYLAKEKRAEMVRRSLVSDQTTLVRRALALIEEDLFRPLRVNALAQACHASESTLLRAFKKEVGVAPATYQRERRLDESVLLLRGSELGVAEVAMRVGYTNVPAFTTAFRRKFGAPPSSLALGQSKGPLLPPEGFVSSRAKPRKKR